MYISNITIKGFRNFDNTTVDFHDGINVIIGHNNAGKTNILKALSLVTSNDIYRRLSVDDFNKNTTIEKLKSQAPSVEINVVLSQSENDDIENEELNIWEGSTIKLEEPLMAQMNYCFYLPNEYLESYLLQVSDIQDVNTIWNIIKRDFIRLYRYELWGGNTDDRSISISKIKNRFDFQFLDAIRDVGRDMFTGHDKLLRDVLEFFIDYDIRKDKDKSEKEKNDEIKVLHDEFVQKAEPLMDSMMKRLSEGKKVMLNYSDSTGANFDKTYPDFCGNLTESDLLAILKLIVKDKIGIEIPATHNGLGYNNLLYISLLLAKMQAESDEDFMKINTILFPILAIEEPEAHLHPSMQYKFLKFLRQNRDNHNIKQVFITTHSTQITSAVKLDDLICMYKESGKIRIAYPGRCFDDTEEGKGSKHFVQRFLDATNADMFFASKIVFVEGIAEELLLPILAKYKGFNFADHHIVVINERGRYFEHFLKLFDSNNKYSICKKVAVITDRDPVRKTKGSKVFSTCWPYEYDVDEETEYKINADEAIKKYKDHPNIRIFRNNTIYGKTLEYDLMFYNTTSDILIVDSLANINELQQLINIGKFNDTAKVIINKCKNKTIKERLLPALEKIDWHVDIKYKSLLATRYLSSLGKGENAFELRLKLEDNLESEKPLYLNIPPYINEAIEWIIQ